MSIFWLEMKSAIIISLFMVFLLRFPAFAEVVINASVDKTNMAVDATLAYKVTIVSSEKKSPPLKIPKFNGFNVLSQAQSSSFSLVAGGVKTTLVYLFILVPAATGQLRIEPAVIETKDKTYSTQAFQIEVSQANKETKPDTPAEGEPHLPEDFKPETAQSQKVTL